LGVTLSWGCALEAVDEIAQVCSSRDRGRAERLTTETQRHRVKNESQASS
jgi:hypothetical protein